MNPYASNLGSRDPIEVVAETPGHLKELAEKIGVEGVEQTPAPGKWSARKILCHLADTELAFAFRLRQALAETSHVIQPFDQDNWARIYDGFEVNAALDLFAAVRKWNMILIRAVPQSTFSKLVIHPERGEMTFRTLVETMAGHDLNHIRQLEGMVPLSA